MEAQTLINILHSRVGYCESAHKDEVEKGAHMAYTILQAEVIKPLEKWLESSRKGEESAQTQLSQWSKSIREIAEWGGQT